MQPVSSIRNYFSSLNLLPFESTTKTILITISIVALGALSLLCCLAAYARKKYEYKQINPNNGFEDGINSKIEKIVGNTLNSDNSEVGLDPLDKTINVIPDRLSNELHEEQFSDERLKRLQTLESTHGFKLRVSYNDNQTEMWKEILSNQERKDSFIIFARSVINLFEEACKQSVIHTKIGKYTFDSFLDSIRVGVRQDQFRALMLKIIPTYPLLMGPSDLNVYQSSQNRNQFFKEFLRQSLLCEVPSGKSFFLYTGNSKIMKLWLEKYKKHDENEIEGIVRDLYGNIFYNPDIDLEEPVVERFVEEIFSEQIKFDEWKKGAQRGTLQPFCVYLIKYLRDPKNKLKVGQFSAKNIFTKLHEILGQDEFRQLMQATDKDYPRLRLKNEEKTLFNELFVIFAHLDRSILTEAIDSLKEEKMGDEVFVQEFFEILEQIDQTVYNDFLDKFIEKHLKKSKINNPFLCATVLRHVLKRMDKEGMIGKTKAKDLLICILNSEGMCSEEFHKMMSICFPHYPFIPPDSEEVKKRQLLTTWLKEIDKHYLDFFLKIEKIEVMRTNYLSHFKIYKNDKPDEALDQNLYSKALKLLNSHSKMKEIEEAKSKFTQNSLQVWGWYLKVLWEGDRDWIKNELLKKVVYKPRSEEQTDYPNYFQYLVMIHQNNDDDSAKFLAQIYQEESTFFAQCCFDKNESCFLFVGPSQPKVKDQMEKIYEILPKDMKNKPEDFAGFYHQILIEGRGKFDIDIMGSSILKKAPNNFSEFLEYAKTKKLHLDWMKDTDISKTLSFEGAFNQIKEVSLVGCSDLSNDTLLLIFQKFPQLKTLTIQRNDLQSEFMRRAFKYLLLDIKRGKRASITIRFDDVSPVDYSEIKGTWLDEAYSFIFKRFALESWIGNKELPYDETTYLFAKSAFEGCITIDKSNRKVIKKWLLESKFSSLCSGSTLEDINKDLINCKAIVVTKNGCLKDLLECSTGDEKYDISQLLGSDYTENLIVMEALTSYLLENRMTPTEKTYELLLQLADYLNDTEMERFIQKRWFEINRANF